jgi:inner membrane protein involved in colicin E2 resistance
MSLLLIGVPFGSFYDLVLFVGTLAFISSSLISVSLNGVYLVTKKKPVRILHMIVPTLLLVLSILYVLYVINEDYPN